MHIVSGSSWRALTLRLSVATHKLRFRPKSRVVDAIAVRDDAKRAYKLQEEYVKLRKKLGELGKALQTLERSYICGLVEKGEYFERKDAISKDIREIASLYQIVERKFVDDVKADDAVGMASFADFVVYVGGTPVFSYAGSSRRPSGRIRGFMHDWRRRREERGRGDGEHRTRAVSVPSADIESVISFLSNVVAEQEQSARHKIKVGQTYYYITTNQTLVLTSFAVFTSPFGVIVTDKVKKVHDGIVAAVRAGGIDRGAFASLVEDGILMPYSAGARGGQEGSEASDISEDSAPAAAG